MISNCLCHLQQFSRSLSNVSPFDHRCMSNVWMAASPRNEASTWAIRKVPLYRRTLKVPEYQKCGRFACARSQSPKAETRLFFQNLESSSWFHNYHHSHWPFKNHQLVQTFRENSIQERKCCQQKLCDRLGWSVPREGTAGKPHRFRRRRHQHALDALYYCIIIITTIIILTFD